MCNNSESEIYYISAYQKNEEEKIKQNSLQKTIYFLSHHIISCNRIRSRTGEFFVNAMLRIKIRKFNNYQQKCINKIKQTDVSGVSEIDNS